MNNGHTIICIAILALSGCAKAENRPDVDPMPSPELLAKVSLYETLADAQKDADGFVYIDTCDSIHWSALGAAVTGPINIRAAMDGSRKLHRRPLGYAECYPTDSGSSISQDALLMVLAYGVAYEDVGLLQDVFSYGKDHRFVMGDGDAFRTVMRPSLQSLYARAIHKFGGADFAERFLPPIEFGVREDFEAHLQVVSILIQAKVDGAITDGALEILRAQAARQPENALFAAALSRFDGSVQARAQELLMHYWPNDRLPTSSDWCESWLTQRDFGTDWEPCPDQGKTHSGGDFLFAAAVLTGRF